MAGEKISFACKFCTAINLVPLDSVKNKVGKVRVILACGRCARVNEPQRIEKSDEPGHEGENFLECIKFTGGEIAVPVGPITIANRTMWTDVDGNAWTAEEFTMKYGVHPGIFWRNKIMEEQAVLDAFLLGHPAVFTHK